MGDSTMALAQKNTLFVALKKGDRASGYLVAVGTQSFSPKHPGQPPSEVPTLILQNEDGRRVKVLLGASVRDDVKNLILGHWTEVRKSKEERVTRSGNRIIEYELLQDDARFVEF
jgi:hypothetical protein